MEGLMFPIQAPLWQSARPLGFGTQGVDLS